MICLGVWMAVFWARPYQPIALLAISGSALWAMRRNYIPTWLAVIITMTPLLLVKTGVSHLGAMLGLSFATFFDPSGGPNMPVLARLLNLLAMLLFLSFDGHLWLISLLADSFH
ncbi:flagellar biosynthetic protein FliR, partial [Escherichia coli]|uniref:flagellar biosynthetic protein FliR n=1 Tax=Escherichia coli TaxID=562 RepID=UPI003F778203